MLGTIHPWFSSLSLSKKGNERYKPIEGRIVKQKGEAQIMNTIDVFKERSFGINVTNEIKVISLYYQRLSISTWFSITILKSKKKSHKSTWRQENI